MKFLILAMCVCIASAAPRKAKASTPQPKSSSNQDIEAVVLRSDTNVNPDGFEYAYETGNGISGSAVGTLKKVDTVDTLSVQGSYQYTAEDGSIANVQYIADENGYQPQSDLLPVAPPIPVAIARALEYIAAHPPAE